MMRAFLPALPAGCLGGRPLFFALIVLTLLFRAWFAHVLPFTGDEAYFYYWGVVPDWGFYDHPPMVGWWLYALRQVSEAPLWLRLPSVLLPAVLAWAVWRTLLSKGETLALQAAILVLLAPPHVWNVAITTDTPLVYFSFFSALCFLHAVRLDDGRAYLAAGLLLGGAFLSKYFSGLLALAYVAAILWRPSRPKLLGGLWLMLGLLPAVALNVAWNMDHCWSNIMFNIFNRHGDAGGSLKTPLLYVLSLLYLLTPPVVVQLVRARAGLKALTVDPAGQALVVVAFLPLAIFALMSSVKTIGLHWLLSFVPFVLMACALAVEALTRQRLVRFFVGFAAVQMGLVMVGLTLPIETWRNSAKYSGLVMTVKAEEVLQKLMPYAHDHVLTTDGYSPSVTLSFNAGRYFPVFGPASSHARHDDILTDFRAFAGRNILMLSKRPPDEAEFRAYFQTLEVEVFEVRGAKFWMMRGRGFNYEAYRESVLETARARWYQVPAWLPMRGCYFCDRYFPERACQAK